MRLTRRGAMAAVSAAAVLAGRPLAAAATGTGTVALYDPALPGARERAAARGRPLALDPDLNATWRQLAAHRGPIAGETRWAALVTLRGLAAEQRRRLRADTVLPHGGLAWLIA